MGAAADDVVLLFVANELHRKGFATLVDALGSWRDPRVQLHVVGRVEPGGYAGRIADLGLTDRIHWHGAQGDVAPWFAGADLFVLPTQYEPFGNVIVEALAMGVPVVTTAIAGAAAAIADGRNGLLQRRPTDADELASLLRRATAPTTLATLTEHASDGLDRYEWDVVTAQLAGLLAHVHGSQ
jgi:UDP-glucose:(heptosyl)LPS alpha-1,3-glucosyltransferase